MLVIVFVIMLVVMLLGVFGLLCVGAIFGGGAGGGIATFVGFHFLQFHAALGAFTRFVGFNLAFFHRANINSRFLFLDLFYFGVFLGVVSRNFGGEAEH